MTRILLTFCFLLATFGIQAQHEPDYTQGIQTGADQTEIYLPLLKDKRIALVANQTSLVNGVHLLDTLLAQGMKVQKVFALEHGFRGDADAGARITDGKDEKTGVPVVSLYGASKKPKPEHLKDVDFVIFDIQDVGARFYTYISSMHYVMEACAQNKVKFMVLDRPNPNGHYVDGPVLQPAYKSFIGMHPVPIVHGMTVGEFAQMINGEGWLEGKVKADLTVIPCRGYDHNSFYKLPVRPSPNLPNMASIYLYPTLCLFEGTAFTVGRGTDRPFQFIGAPGFTAGDTTITPRSTTGATKPKHMGLACKGYDLQKFGFECMRDQKQIYLHWIVGMFRDSKDKDNFFKSESSFNHLAGNEKVKQMIIAGKSVDEIRKSWTAEVTAFKTIRKKYLLYSDFE